MYTVNNFIEIKTALKCNRHNFQLNFATVFRDGLMEKDYI